MQLQNGSRSSSASLVVFLLLLGASPSALFAWREVLKPCHADCTKLGNCNHELGTCECPFGRLGPACETDVIPACRPSSHPDALPYIGTWLLRSCQCWRQLHQLEQPQLQDKLFVIPATLERSDTPCFELDGVPSAQQYSDIPAAGTPGVKWYEHPSPAPDEPLRPVEGAAPDTTVTGHMVAFRQLPLSDCHNRCSERGACLQITQRDYGPPPDTTPTCHCTRGHKGKACEEQAVETCLNKCGDRGECRGGFCKCPSGYWGMDCTRSRAYQPDPGDDTANAFNMTHLRIYRYELPWHVAFFQEPKFREVHTEYTDGTYGAWEMFFNQFSHDWVTRTENPHEANMFYVPLLVFMRTDNTGLPQLYVQHAVQWLRGNHSALWGRNQGKDHFIWLSNDQGACDIEPQPELQNLIKIVHFGMQAEMPWRTTAVHPMPLDMRQQRSLWQMQQQQQQQQQLQQQRQQQQQQQQQQEQHEQQQQQQHQLQRSQHLRHLQREQRQHRRLYGLGKEQYHCFMPGKDVVAPDNRHRPRDPWMAHLDDAYKEALEGKSRPYLLFFGGRVRSHSPAYSGGARLEFHKHVVAMNYSDVKFGGGHETYRQSTFCLCPYGEGFGSRIGHAVMGACIPIILQDNVHQPLEDVLFYPDFAVRMRKADVPHMMQRLRSITPAQLLAYRQKLHQVRLAFTWSVDHGGQAYPYTLKSLHRKLFNLWGYHY